MCALTRVVDLVEIVRTRFVTSIRPTTERPSEPIKEWNNQDLDDALSEEALTAAVMPRYHVNNSVRRAMGTKFRKGF